MFKIELRDTVEDDLEVFYAQYLDPRVSQMIAFLPKERSNRDVFMAHWKNNVLSKKMNTNQTILVDGKIAGSLVCFEHDQKREIGYVLGQEFWGRGIATQALAQFLAAYSHRPLYAGVASDNIGSIRVLEKCGFKAFAHERAFAPGRGEEIEETLLKLV